MAQWISSRVLVLIESFTLMENVSPQFDGVIVARIQEILVWEKF